MSRTALGAAPAKTTGSRLAATDDGEWGALCAAVPGMAPLAGLDLAARRERRREIEAMIAAWARARGRGD